MTINPAADTPPSVRMLHDGNQEDAGSRAIHDLLPLVLRPRPALAQRVRRAIARAERARKVRAWAMAAGVILLLGGAVLALQRLDDDGLHTRDGRRVPAGAGLVPDAGPWNWPATGARLEAETAPVLIARRGLGPGDLQLDAGIIAATVDPQRQVTPLVIRTPHAIATVVGTGFRLEVDAGRSRLQVVHGTVSFVHDDREERIQAGGTATAPDVLEPAWHFHEVTRTAIIDGRLREFSGMVVDPDAPERLWACADHGNPAALAAIDQQGRVCGMQPVAGAVNHDWEELCLVRLGDRTWLAIGDIGKSRHQEPAAILLVTPQLPLTVARRITLRLPAGVMDLDCLAWDGVERAFYLVGKDGDHPLLRCAWGEGEALTAVVVGRVHAHRPSALAIDAAGTRMVLLDEDGTLTVFGRRDGAWDPTRVRSSMRIAGMPRPQALAWDPDGTGLWVAGEGRNSPLIHLIASRRAP